MTFNDYREIEISKLQHQYLPGTRIQLVNAGDVKDGLQPGEKGTVEIVDDAGQIFVAWDSGVHTVVTPEKDEFKRLCIDDQIQEAEVIRDEQIAKKHRKRDRDVSIEREDNEYDEIERD